MGVPGVAPALGELVLVRTFARALHVLTIENDNLCRGSRSRPFGWRSAAEE
ncbi:hypothetical protein GFS60_07287 (plasmid) [Rhodococcus sp. WAY2]|nr:hypothetical protein GFS60_07287 [Rhodococcus sp. WAY2]